MASPEGTAWQSQGLSPEMPYFSARVMLINLEKWRRLGIDGEVIDLARNHRRPYDDQCAQNAIIKGGWTPISPNEIYKHPICMAGITSGSITVRKSSSQHARIHPSSTIPLAKSHGSPMNTRFTEVL
jgi:hypothetical protein